MYSTYLFITCNWKHNGVAHVKSYLFRHGGGCLNLHYCVLKISVISNFNIKTLQLYAYQF